MFAFFLVALFTCFIRIMRRFDLWSDGHVVTFSR